MGRRLPISADLNRECSRVGGLGQNREGKRAALVFKVGKGCIPLRAGIGFGPEPSKELKFAARLPSMDLAQGLVHGNADSSG
jgi:hypothetical protein